LKDSIKNYVLGLVQENLGLPVGEVVADDLPRDLVDLIASAVRGESPGEPERPYVEEELGEFFRETRVSSLEKNGYFLYKARWPNASRFAVCLTHDVDSIAHTRGHIFSTRQRFGRGDLILGMIGLKALYNNLLSVADEERRRGFRSSFFILTLSYSLSELSGTLRLLKNDGWEIGLHGDFGTHDSPVKMREALERFRGGTGLTPTGVREHYLRFDFEKTWEIMEKIGFIYDSSIGPREALGFPMGLTAPFHPPDRDWLPMRLLEIPLALMDTTLWGYLKRSEEEGLRDVELTIEKISRVGGLFTLLWHQEAFRMRGGRLYGKILEQLANKNCSVSSAEGVASWWNARAAPLVKEEGEYHFKGSPPEGLCLQFESSEGRAPQVAGGTLEEGEGGQVVRVTSQAFSLRVE